MSALSFDMQRLIHCPLGKTNGPLNYQGCHTLRESQGVLIYFLYYYLYLIRGYLMFFIVDNILELAW